MHGRDQRAGANTDVTRPDTADLQDHRAALVREIGTLKLLIRPSETGHLHTTIRVLEWRIRQIDADIEGENDTA